jgi:hypothetical protein
VEKALLDGLHLHYLHAHQIALRIEQAPVRAAGISWRDYNRFTKAHEKKIGDERVVRVPSDLDLTPYRGGNRTKKGDRPVSQLWPIGNALLGAGRV